VTTKLSERQAPARRRILDTATRLFYGEGVHAVGIDRIIAEAGVAKATFYHHFRTKDDLVRAYLDGQYQQQREGITTVLASLDGAEPREALTRMFVAMGDFGGRPEYRGCAFINAAAEYPDPTHPVRQVITEQRRWLRNLLRDRLTTLGDPAPDRTADILMLIRDGIFVGADLDDPAPLRAAIPDAITRVLPGQRRR
jgi:AcrR family transcriptional regulator